MFFYKELVVPFGKRLTKKWIISIPYPLLPCPLPPYPCRILCSVLLSAAVIMVRLVLIIEVGTNWRQVKGIKSYLTLSGGSKSQDQIGHLWMSFGGCHSVDVHCECHFVEVTLLKSICWFHFVDVTLKISLLWCHFVKVTLLMSLYFQENICERATDVIVIKMYDIYI